MHLNLPCSRPTRPICFLSSSRKKCLVLDRFVFFLRLERNALCSMSSTDFSLRAMLCARDLKEMISARNEFYKTGARPVVAHTKTFGEYYTQKTERLYPLFTPKLSESTIFNDCTDCSNQNFRSLTLFASRSSDCIQVF